MLPVAIISTQLVCPALRLLLCHGMLLGMGVAIMLVIV